MNDRVAVTGLGLVTPIGVGTAAFGAAQRAGMSGVGPVTHFDCDGFDTRIAAEVAHDATDWSAWIRPAKSRKLMSRPALFAVVAAAMARQDAGLRQDDVDPERVAVSLGAGGMGPTDIDMFTSHARAVLEAARSSDNGEWSISAFLHAFAAKTNPITPLRGLPNLAAAHVAIQQEARGPNGTITTACTAGTQAIGEGRRMIERGEADVVFAGGTDAGVNPVSLLGFSMLGTLSRHNDVPGAASRPFDRDRDGFVIGEGAAVLVLERESLARARGAHVLAELAGYGVTCDAYRITDERPDAGGAIRAIERCLEDADACQGDVGYVNAHGTGTVMNDLTESKAIKAALGAAADLVPVSSTKSMIGHLLAAAGAVELVAAILALRDGYVPPTINLDEPDPGCDLDYVPLTARETLFDVALSNSFGFGGQNACLLIRRW